MFYKEMWEKCGRGIDSLKLNYYTLIGIVDMKYLQSIRL